MESVAEYKHNVEEYDLKERGFIKKHIKAIVVFINCAYVSAAGDVLKMISIGIAIYRYDIKKSVIL